MIYDCIIIGAGPAGLIASVQLKRDNFNVLLIEKNAIGGLLKNSNLVENYLGFPNGITGTELVKVFKNQLRSSGLNPIHAEVKKISSTGNIYSVVTEVKSYKSYAVLIASGTMPKMLSVKGEAELIGKKVFYEIASLPETLNCTSVLVIGGGDVAFDYALNLKSRGYNPFIVMRHQPKCLGVLQKRAAAESIPYLINQNIIEITESGDAVFTICEGITFKSELILVAVGRDPVLPEINEASSKGIFYAGDVINADYRQVHIATGDGLKAAMKISKFLNQKMKIVKEIGNEKLAKVFIGNIRGRNVEFAESIQPPLPRNEKWVITISCLFGCPVKCLMCDAGQEYCGKLDLDDMLEQIDHAVMRFYPDRNIQVKKFKIQFARMGEPAFNPAVLDVLEELPKRYVAPGLIPSVSTIGPKVSSDFFEKLLDIKNRLYANGKFQMQFSIHTSDVQKRDTLMPIKKMSFPEIAEFGERFFNPGDRKITLNFNVMKGYPIEPAILRSIFQPEVFIIKLTPLNPTINARNNSLETELDPDNKSTVSSLVDKFRFFGFDTLVSIGDTGENEIGSNCGQYVSVLKSTQYQN